MMFFVVMNFNAKAACINNLRRGNLKPETRRSRMADKLAGLRALLGPN